MPLPDLDLHSESDEDLLVMMSWQRDQPEVAKAACDEFYQRHVKYVFAVIQRAHGPELGHHGVEDMVMETFIRVFEKADTYRPCGSENAESQRRNALAWVGTIANNTCIDYFRRADTELVFADDLDSEGRTPETHDCEELPELSDDLQLVHEAMATLDERERTVLRVTMAYWKIGAEHQRLPNEVSEELARSFDTTPTNIRKIRERAIGKVRDFVDSARRERPGGKP